MADDVENQRPRFADEVTPGARLRAAREAQKLTTKAIAKELHLDTWMLDAIERDEYSALGAPVFAKGHLRKYATTLGLDPDELMVSYYQMDGTRDTPPLIAESILRVEQEQGPRFAWLLPSAIVVAAAAAVSFAALWYLRADAPRPVNAAVPDHSFESTSAAERSTELALPSARAAVPEQQPDDGGDAGGAQIDDDGSNAASMAAEPAASEDITVSVADETPAAAVETAPQAGTVTLMLRFRTESWVEVYDAERRKLLYGMGEADSVQYMSGRPPLRVFLGRASGVDVEVNGQPYPVPAGSRRGTARFSVNAP